MKKSKTVLTEEMFRVVFDERETRKLERQVLDAEKRVFNYLVVRVITNSLGMECKKISFDTMATSLEPILFYYGKQLAYQDRDIAKEKDEVVKAGLYSS